MPFKRRIKILNKALINSSPIGEVRWGLACKGILFASNPFHDSVTRLGGG